jgi:hypothetical protein
MFALVALFATTLASPNDFAVAQQVYTAAVTQCQNTLFLSVGSCEDEFQQLSVVFADSVNTDLNDAVGLVCQSNCFDLLQDGFRQFQQCNLAATTVFQASAGADFNSTLLDANAAIFDIFDGFLDFFCSVNEVGDFCIAELALLSGDAGLDCVALANGGCCSAGFLGIFESFDIALDDFCPGVAVGPPCPSPGQTALFISGSLTTNLQFTQIPEDQGAVRNAIRADIAQITGIDEEFITVGIITANVDGTALVQYSIRGNNDDQTLQLGAALAANPPANDADLADTSATTGVTVLALENSQEQQSLTVLLANSASAFGPSLLLGLVVSVGLFLV